MEGASHGCFRCILLWEAGRGCILTIDELMRRGMAMMNGCYLCKSVAEIYNHVLLWCLVVHKLWSIVYALLGVNWVMAGSAKNEIWAACNSISQRRKFVDLIPLSIFWVIYKEKNEEFLRGSIIWEILIELRTDGFKPLNFLFWVTVYILWKNWGTLLTS